MLSSVGCVLVAGLVCQAPPPALARASVDLDRRHAVTLALAGLPIARQAGAAASAPADSRAVPTASAEAGRKLFVADGCYQCHGYEAQGATTGPRLGPRPIPYAAFTRYVRRPTGQMPPYTEKVASDADLANIYAFLQARPTPPPVASIPLLK